MRRLLGGQNISLLKVWEQNAEIWERISEFPKISEKKVKIPKLMNDEWLIKKGIFAYMRKYKMGDTEPPSQEEISDIRNQYTRDTIFYTEPAIEVVEHQE